MLRLFVALVPPPSIRARLARIRDVLAAAGADVKWVETENIHVTLKFLGAIEPSRLNVIQEALGRAAASHSQFELGFVGSGVFPNRRRPRVVWVGLAGGVADLAALQGDVDAAMTSVGFAPEARPFSGHITLGRVRADGPSPRLLERLDALREEDDQRMTVDAITLMESQLSSRGPTYKRRMEFPLQAR